jgi:hypothetical protein
MTTTCFIAAEGESGGARSTWLLESAQEVILEGCCFMSDLIEPRRLWPSHLLSLLPKAPGVSHLVAHVLLIESSFGQKQSWYSCCDLWELVSEKFVWLHRRTRQQYHGAWAKETYTFYWGNPKVYVITNFKHQGMTSFVSVTLLTRLGSQYICTNLLHLLFCLCHNIGAKDSSLTWLRPTQWCTLGSSIECLERWHLDALLIIAIILKHI